MIKIEQNMLFADRYRLIKCIGRGGFAEVWLADDTLTDLQVAIKIYGGMNDEGLKIFVKEINKVYHLNHTNLLKPQHVAAWQGMPYLVMTYCSAGSLEKKIGQITEQEVWKILHDVASGLAYLQSNNIIHQDIKPANILQDDMGNYVIIDFGISTLARDTLIKSTLRGYTNAGTLAYMAPERFSKDPNPIFASDIWSLGAMLYELLEGNTPFPTNIGGGMQKAGAEIPDITADVSQELKSAIYQMLSLNTWDRPTSAALANGDVRKRTIPTTPIVNNRTSPKQKAQTNNEKVVIPISPYRTTLWEKILQGVTSLWGMFVFVLATIMLIDDFKWLDIQEIVHHINLGCVNLILAIICVVELLKPNIKSAITKLLITTIVVLFATVLSLYLAEYHRIVHYQFTTFLVPTMLSCLLLQIVNVIRINIYKNKSQRSAVQSNKFSNRKKYWLGMCALILVVSYFIPTIVDKIKIDNGKIDAWVEILDRQNHPSIIYEAETFYVKLNKKQNTKGIHYHLTGAERNNHSFGLPPSYDDYTPCEGAKQVSVVIFYTSINGIKLKICTQYFDVHPQMDSKVDLGLSVKWASCNIGADAPEKHGDYYAWGEISSKSEYTWLTYQWCEGNTATLSKYSSNLDKKMHLEISDDVAQKLLDDNWRIPTYEEQRELVTRCDWIYTSRKGVNGYIVKSRKNSNSIFLPVTGCKSGTNLYGEEEFGYYWSSTVNHNDNTEAWILNFGAKGPGFYNSNRYIGRCIRPVCP